MADLKFRTGASATVNTSKEDSLEKKLAGIIGVSTSAIKSLESQLRRDREAEEARKKAEEEARKKAEAAAAANAAARAEAERVAQSKAIKDQLGALLKKPVETTVPTTAAATAQAVYLGQREEEQRKADAKAIKTQAAMDYKQNVTDPAYRLDHVVEFGNKEETTETVEPNYLDRLLDEGNTAGLAYEADRAAAQAEVSRDAYLRNTEYLKNQYNKVQTLQRQIGGLRSKARRTAEEDAQLQELLRQYKTAKDLYDQAAAINEKRTQQYEQAAANKQTADLYSYLGDAENVYSDERGAQLQANIDLWEQLEEVWLYGGTPEYIANNYAQLSELAANAGMSVDDFVADVQANYKTHLREAKAEYAAWGEGKLEHDIMLTLYNLPDADEEMFRRIISFRNITNENTPLAGNTAYRNQTNTVISLERTLQAKYGEEYERILDRMTRLVNEEVRAEQIEYFKSASGMDKAALSVASVATNLLSSPGVLYEYAIQGAEANKRGFYSPMDVNAQGFRLQNITQDVRGITAAELEQKYGSGASFVYSTAMSGIDSFVTGMLFGQSGGVLLGATAASNTMQDITQRGGTVEQAVVGGIAAGVFEMLFESVSIGEMQAMQKTAFTAGSVKDMFSLDTLKTYVGNIAKETGVNFSEEAATEIANIMYDIAVLGDVSNYQIRINELMANDPTLTAAQAKKIIATELALQVVEAGASGALMGATFGTIDTSIAAAGQLSNIRMLEEARILAARLPEDRRPVYDAATVTDQNVTAYALEVYNATKAYNAEMFAAKPQQSNEVAQKAQSDAEEKAAVTVSSLATPQQVYDAQEAGRAAADAEASANTDAAQTRQEPVATVPVRQAETAAVMPQETRNVRAVSNAQTAQNAPVSFDTDDVSAFIAEEAAEIYESLSMYEGTMRDSAVQDEARALRQEGREDVAAALEQIHRDGGVNYGDSIGQRRERDAGESAGGEAGTVAEGAGSDQSRAVQTGLGIDRRTAAENSGAEKVSVRSLGLRNGTTGATVYDITDTTKDPELVDLENAAKLAGADLRFVVGKLAFTNGVTATGIYDNGTIVVTADDDVFTATQIANHELYHWIHSKTPGMTERLVERLKQEFSEQELNELIAAYEQLYAGTGATADMILEEICADMYAGMVREQLAAAKNANLPQFTQEARRIVRERANVSALGERGANGTRAGPEKTKTAAGRDVGSGGYRTARTKDGRVISVVDVDVLSNMDTSTWTDEKKREAREAAKNALLKHRLRVWVNDVHYYVNRTLKRYIAGEFVDFEFGNVLIESGKNQYSAKAKVGITRSGGYIFYDIEDINPTSFEKEEDPPTAASAKTAQVKNTDDFTPTDSPDIRFSISDDTVDTLNTQLEETEQEIDRLEALMGKTYDSTMLLQIDEAKAKRSAIYEELRERHARAARQAARENDEQRAGVLEEIRLIEDHAKELSREATAERAAYKADGDAQHLANAERLRAEAAAERAKAKPMRERAGIEDKREFRPVESKRQTTNRILDLFKIQAGRRAEMRRDLNVILDRTLLQGYVTDSDLESLLHAMYDAGVDVVQPDAAYEDVAKTVRGTTLYISEEVRREFGDDWREMQRALTRAGIKTSLNSSERGIDSLYGELAEGYPGLFDSESTDMRAMLEDIVEAAQLGKAQHRSLADAAQEIGLSSDEDFAALYSEVRAELRSFADRADMEVRFRENLLKDTNERNAQRLQAERERFDAKLADLRKTYADSARRASERRQRSEQMTKIRNALKRLNRASERNDQTLTKILSRQTPEVQQLMNRVRDEISTVANRLTDRKLNNLRELKLLYEDRKANDPNFIPNPATEKALERVGMVHLDDLSVEDLQALYDTVTRVAHDFDEANRLIGEGMDQQLDNAGMEMIDEIEFAKGSSAKGNTALWLNERSLSPSRALLRYVGYDRSGIMGKLVESLEKGDINAIGYTLGADMIFKEFVGRADVRKWLKTAAGENAEMIELEVPRILEWGEGDTPIFDQKNGEVIKDKVYLTKMMVVNMARDLKNEQNLWHVKYGGYTFPDAKLYKKGKLQEAYARSNSKAVRMSPEFVRQIVDEHLDKIGKEYVELLDQYYDQFSKEKVNGVSRQLDGVDKAISDSYNPIRTSKAFRAQNYNVFDGTLEGMGSLKNRQHFAGNPIVLADADETMRWHRDNMARYVGYAIPMRNFKALMNYSNRFGEETIRAQIETKYGANAGKFLDDLAKIIEEGKLSESEGFTALDKLTGKYVSRVLGFNISSMLKQLSALSTAGTSHGFGVVNHALATPRKVDVELIRKYTPYYDYRGAGYTYAEVANLVRDTNAQQSKALQAILGKNWLEATDLWVNRRLWLAAEYVVQKRGLRPGTQAEIDAGRDPYYKAVAEVFNRMTHDTQTNYNTMSRPIALRSTNLVVRMATMFKTDALQLQGIARESFGAYQTAKRKFEDDPSSANRAELQRQKQKLINGAVGIVSASIMQSILEMVAKLVRGDDDDYRDENGKLTLGAAGKEIAKDTLYSLVGCVIFGDQIADMISALVTDEMLWEPDIPSVSALYDMYEDVKAFGEQAGEIIGTTIALRKNGGDADAYWKANWDVFAGKIAGATKTLVSYMTGLAIPNMEKTVLGLINHAFPQIPIQYSDYTGDFAKGDLVNLEGEALEAALHAYLTDEVGELGETAEAEILRLYELYGNKALPGANAPTSVKEVDENGNEIERKPTLEELGNWNVNYRLTFIDAMGDIIGSETYNALGDAEKLKLIARANEYARDMAKEAAGIPVDLKGWKLDAKEAFDAGAPLADAILFYTRASVLTSDVDEEGNTIANSKARKVLELLDDISIPDNQKRQLLRGELSDKANADLDALLDAGYSFADAVGMLHDEFTGERDVDVLTGYLADGFNPESARAMYEAVEALEPEDGKKQVSNAQELAAIAASNIPVADKWTAFAGTFGEDDTKALEKMEAVRAAGGTPDDYAELKANGQIDAYLRGIEAGFNPNTALRIVSAVAALPDLPEGESYDTSERQLAAVQACQTPEEQVKAYAMYGGADNAKTNEAKFTAALDFDVTPEMYLEARALAKASYDADGNGSLKQDEVVAALEAMDLTDRQRAALFQLFGSSWKKNPYGNTATIRDAYAAAKE